jgi:hypothetical protein
MCKINKSDNDMHCKIKSILNLYKNTYSLVQIMQYSYTYQIGCSKYSHNDKNAILLRSVIYFSCIEYNTLKRNMYIGSI